jgi:hypothetical protein
MSQNVTESAALEARGRILAGATFSIGQHVYRSRRSGEVWFVDLRVGGAIDNFQYFGVLTPRGRVLQFRTVRLSCVPITSPQAILFGAAWHALEIEGEMPDGLAIGGPS